MTNSDPKDFFSSERTFLAWVRTGISIIVLGFVVAKFGLFIRLLSAQGGDMSVSANDLASTILGISFVLLGSLVIVGAGIQHQRFISALEPKDLPPRYSRHLAFVLGLVVALLGAGLSIYLLLV